MSVCVKVVLRGQCAIGIYSRALTLNV